MGRREIRREIWAKQDPEFLELIRKEAEKFEVGCEIAHIRVNAGLSRSQFAALLRIDLEKVELLESGDLWDTKESTINWINEVLSL